MGTTVTKGVYPKSKLLAEKAAWDFVANLPEAERFELVTILPSKILGPAIRTESSVSSDFCLQLLSGDMKEAPYRAFPIVDVRDLANAHLQAIKVPEAANRRFIISNETVWFKDLIAHVYERFGPDGWPIPTEVEARPSDFDDSSILYMDNTASKTIL